jgi:hypothetical protein
MKTGSHAQLMSTPAAAGSSTEPDAILAELAERFAAFRRTNQRFTRVPRDLRAAVASAMRSGVAPAQLRRTCGLSTSQLERWRDKPSAGAPSQVEKECARIFSVVDDVPPQAGNTTDATADEALELRIGPWSVRVGFAEPHGRER